MAKRANLRTACKTVAASRATAPAEDRATTAMVLDRADIELLSLVAIVRRRTASPGSGRQSMSSVVRELIDLHRDDLEREAGGLK